MSEWPIEHAWKACLPQGNEGSNPSLSADKYKKAPLALFSFSATLKILIFISG
jgi:hypothetical protein